MARNRGKKALYEVMSKYRVKPGSGKAVEPLHSKKPQDDTPVDDAVVEKKEIATQWWKKPRVVQYQAGRLEFSMSYQLAITLVLIFLLLLIIAYGLGQRSYAAKQQAAATSAPTTQNNNQDNSMRQTASGNIPPAGNAVERQPVNPDAVATKSTGSNVIVLKEYHALADLVAAQEYFRKNLIMTEIDPRNNRYFLQTVDKYDNPGRPGTDGYEARQKIVEIGRQYRAPENLESFAPNYFDDAYGKRVE